MSQNLNQVVQVTPAEMRKAVFGWIGNGRDDESKKRSFELYTAIFGFQFVGATADDAAFLVQKSDMVLSDGADYKLRPIAGLLVSVASVTPAPAKCSPCTCHPPLTHQQFTAGIDWGQVAAEQAPAPKAVDEAPSKGDRIKVLKQAINALRGRHLKAGPSVKSPYTLTQPKAVLRVFLAKDKKSYLAVLTSNPPKSVVGVQATTLRELQEALEQLLDSVEDGGFAPTVDSEHMDMKEFRKVFGVK